MTLGDFSDRIPRALETVLFALRNPADDPLTALLGIAGITIMLLIGVLVALIVLSAVPDKSSDAQYTDASPVRVPRSRRERAITAGVVAFILIVLSIVGLHYSATDAACSSCHQIGDAVASHGSSSHESAHCRQCHIPPGLSGSVLARFEGIGNLVASLTDDEGETASVRNSACLSCHSSVADGVVTSRGVRMRHSDVLNVGYACTACHNTAGHGQEVRRVRYPEMAQCVMCHDDSTAESDCVVCHATDVGSATRQPSDLYPMVTVPVDSCRGCHPMQPCIDCHGLELPHSYEFMRGYHARKGLLEPETCKKCHDTGPFCNGCHRFPIGADGLWRSAHGYGGQGGVWHERVPSSATITCVCHDVDTKKYCDYCHGPQPER